MKFKSPFCQGSGYEPQVKQSFRQAVCPFCGHVVAIIDGKLSEHWWAREAQRHHGGLGSYRKPKST